MSSVQHAKGEKQEQVAEGVAKLVSQTQERLHETSNRVRHLAENIASQAKTRAEEVQNAVQEHPIRALLAAVGIGAVCGMVFASLRKRKELPS